MALPVPSFFSPFAKLLECCFCFYTTAGRDGITVDAESNIIRLHQALGPEIDGVCLCCQLSQDDSLKQLQRLSMAPFHLGFAPAILRSVPCACRQTCHLYNRQQI